MFLNIKNNINIMKNLDLKIIDSFEENQVVSKFQANKDTLDKTILKKFENDEILDGIQEIKKYRDFLIDKFERTDSTKNVFDKYNISYSLKDIQNLHFIKNGFWDMIFQKCFYIENNYYFFDQEWYEENMPIEFILYRAILYCDSFNKYISKLSLYNSLGITSEQLQIFQLLDNIFQNNIKNSKIPDFNTLESILERKKSQIQQYGRTNKELEMENILLRSDISIKDEKIQNMNEEIRRKDAIIKNKEDVMNQICNSLSWKITEPLRRVRRYRIIVKINKIVKKIKFNNIKVLIGYIRKNGVKLTLSKIEDCINESEPMCNLNEKYTKWIKLNEPTKRKLKKQRKTKFKIMPKISVIVPLYKTSINFFEELIECLINQTYLNWELCLADGSPQQNEELKKKCEKDSRIIYKFLNENKGIAGNTNEAIKMATGDYIALFDHNDLLPQFSLYEVVKCINENPDVEFIYSDEDKITTFDKLRFNPHFKPDFSLDFLRANNYICHFSIFKKELMDKLGGERSKYDGAQDFDLLLRMSENTNKIVHIPKILYHCRVHPNSTSKCDTLSKSYAFEAEVAAIQDHIDRIGLKGKVMHGETLGTYRIKYDVIGNPKVSILIPNKDEVKSLKSCINSILEITTYSNYEIVVIENNSIENETFIYYEELEKNDKIKVLRYPEKGFNYSKIINYGVKNTKSHFVVQLNNDTKLETPDWLENMIGFAQREDVGAVGVRLYYPDNTIQHAGLVLGVNQIAGQIFKGLPRYVHGYFDRESSIQNFSAVTAACIMCKRSIYEEVGYMNEDLAVAFNDIDFCLKIREKGKLIVYNPFINFVHFESKSRGYEDTPEKKERFNKEIDIFMSRWNNFYKRTDPYYNKNFSKNSLSYEISTEICDK